mmetsp:Transcript_871/g.2101  ORF Transcript_871/g.2101 Transcript_871/m.2101 type:complete len:124 (+) Transcript_871:826-1197(+)
MLMGAKLLGDGDGFQDGDADGNFVGVDDGVTEGLSLGAVENDGPLLGEMEGFVVGKIEGVEVGTDEGVIPDKMVMSSTAGSNCAIVSWRRFPTNAVSKALLNLSCTDGISSLDVCNVKRATTR